MDVGSSDQTGHDVPAGASWAQVTHGLSRFNQRLWIGQVGGDG